MEPEIKELINLLGRDADCRCGNVSLSREEVLAIKHIINIVSNMNTHCINNGCHMNEE